MSRKNSQQDNNNSINYMDTYIKPINVKLESITTQLGSFVDNTKTFIGGVNGALDKWIGYLKGQNENEPDTRLIERRVQMLCNIRQTTPALYEKIIKYGNDIHEMQNEEDKQRHVADIAADFITLKQDTSNVNP